MTIEDVNFDKDPDIYPEEKQSFLDEERICPDCGEILSYNKLLELYVHRDKESLEKCHYAEDIYGTRQYDNKCFNSSLKR